MKKTLGAVAAAAAIAISLSACGGSAPASAEAKGEINYWLWDANQLPAYQQCADDFTKANPDIKVKITQRGWDDYWTTLTNGFVAGTAPDVFTNHLSKYPEYAAKKQLLSLDDAVAKDGIKLDELHQGPRRPLGGPGRQALRPAQGLGHRGPLLQQGHDGLRGPHRRADGQPGLEPAGRRQLREGHRAPDRGQERRARRRGRLRQEQRRRLRPRPRRRRLRAGPDRVELPHRHHRLDRTRTRTRGAPSSTTTTPSSRRPSPGGPDWSRRATCPSWKPPSAPAWRTTSAPARPPSTPHGRLADRPVHRATRASKPASPPPRRAPRASGAACSTAWPTPIWAGTKNPAASIKWVEYLASTACQDVVASKAVVFPALTAPPTRPPKPSRPRASTSPPSPTHVKDKTTFLFPITDNAAKVDGIMKPAMDAVLVRQEARQLPDRSQRPGQRPLQVGRPHSRSCRATRRHPPCARIAAAGIPRTST